ncbi:MAG: phosphoribosylpyrophosphate synthetase [Saprospiraceae bacterium]
MKTFDTLTEALADLNNRGYTADFNLKGNGLASAKSRLESHPEDFEVDEFYRFEGATNPADNMVLYALSAKDGLCGVLVDAYGPYAENLSPAVVQKLHIKRKCR